MIFEINKEIVFSTAHVSADTGALLNDDKLEELAMINDGFSHRILVPSPRELGGLSIRGEIPSELVDLLWLAVGQDCKWLLLDVDGPVLEELISYDW